MRSNGRNKLIWVLAVMLALLVLSAVGLDSAFATALALEQAPRCGMPEHVHGEDCYVGDILVCREKMHTHTENCYLVLLKDNDINTLLTYVAHTEEKSLESVISNTVFRAAALSQYQVKTEDEVSPSAGPTASPSMGPTASPTLGPTVSPSVTPSLTPSASPSVSPSLIPSVAPSVSPTPSPSASAAPSLSPLAVQPQVVTNDDIANLNTAVAANNVDSVVVLNENLASRAVTVSETEEELLAALLSTGNNSGGASTLAVEPGTDSGSEYKAAVYVYVADVGNSGWKCIGELDFTVTESNYIYTQYIETARITSLLSNAGISSYKMYYYYNWDDEWNNTTPSGTSTVFGSYDYVQYFAKQGFDIRIVGDNDDNEEGTSLKFYTVNIVDASGTETTQYVLYGNTVTLDSAYTWTDESGNAVSGAQTITSGPKTFTAQSAPTEYTVAFDSNGGSTVESQTVKPGRTVSKPTDPTKEGHVFGGWYTDEDCTAAYTFGTTVNNSFTLYAKWTRNQYTVTYLDGEGSAIKDPVTVGHGDTVTLPEGYDWVDGDGNKYDGGQEVTITGNTAFIGTIKTYTVIIIDENGNEIKQTVEHGGTVTLDKLPDGWGWVGSDGTAYAGGAATAPITENVTYTAISAYVVRYLNENGMAYRDPDQVAPGGSVTLPELTETYANYRWVDQNGNVYTGGTSVTVNGPMTFTLSPTITVNYVVNFPTYGSDFSDTIYWNTVTKPTVNGGDSASVAAVKGMTVSVLDVSAREVIVDTSHGTATAGQFNYPVYFQYWVADDTDGTEVWAGTVLTWEQLEDLDADGDGEVTLTGSWDHGQRHPVNFCFSYNDADITGDKEDYTPSLWTSYMGGEIDTTIAITEADAYTYEADQYIRGLYGRKDSGMWMASFPSDDYILSALADYVTRLEVDGKTVQASQLTSEYYTIRWGTIFWAGDGWHVDGRLVKKYGNITVDKVFGGIEDAVNQAREGFYILAENGTYDKATDTFEAYTRETDDKTLDLNGDGFNDYFKQYVLVLDEATRTKLQNDNTYPYATFQIYDQETNSGGEIIDDWLITGVELGEYWQFTEHAVRPTYTDASLKEVEYSWYAEYTVTDSDGEYSNIAEFGSQAMVVGKTYALDEDPDQGLTVDFTNYYYSNDSILIRKIDGDTGKPLSGAEFQLWQKAVQLKFKDDGNGVYTVSPDGTIGSITTNSEGFSVITIDGFSFDNGELVVKEVTAPAGYDKVGDVTVHYLDGKSGTAGIIGIAGVTDTTKYDYHAEYNDQNGGVLVVKDHSSVYTSVTVTKDWADADSAADSVTVVLQANGGNAGILFPALTGHEQVLNETNHWTYTWTDLPAYANGELVEWSVKEVKVGGDPTLSDGVSFANWIVAYSAPTRTDTNGDGLTDNWSITVTNTLRRTLIYLTKVDQNGAALPGVSFTFEAMEYASGGWTAVASRTVATDANGQILFDNLSAGGYYRLTETVPKGYFGQEEVYVTIDGAGVIRQVTLNADGTVTTGDLDGSFYQYTTPYNLRVTNMQAVELPSTGGSGTIGYTIGGALLMAAAVLMLYKKSRRKEDAPYV